MPYNKYGSVVQAPGEENSGEELVETAGYIPKRHRIRMMLEAGIQLKAVRRDAFDFPEEFNIDDLDEIPVDLTRSPDFNYLDFAPQLLRQVSENIKRKKAERKAAAVEEIVEEPPPEPPEEPPETP